MVLTVSENAAIKSLYLLAELDCSGECLKPVIVDSLRNIEISGNKRKSDCPIFAVCWAAVCEVPLALLTEGRVFKT